MAKKVTTGRILDVLSSGRSALRGRDERVALRVHVDPTCPRDAALARRREQSPRQPRPFLPTRH